MEDDSKYMKEEREFINTVFTNTENKTAFTKNQIKHIAKTMAYQLKPEIKDSGDMVAMAMRGHTVILIDLLRELKFQKFICKGESIDEFEMHKLLDRDEFINFLLIVFLGPVLCCETIDYDAVDDVLERFSDLCRDVQGVKDKED